MMPSPLAALAYVAVKVVGYAAFASGMNKLMDKNVIPYKFAAVKTALGLTGGVASIVVLWLVNGSVGVSDTVLFVSAIPARLVAWSLALGIFYGFRQKPMWMSAAAFAGVAWSYVLDCIMWLIYKILPGMVMPFC